MVAVGEVKYQYLAGICVNIVSISYGAFCGWTSAGFLELQSENSPLETGPLSYQEAGWVGSMLCVGGVFGTIFFAWCADKIGRKRCLLLVALPSLLGWIIIPCSRNPIHLYVARFLGGAAGGGCFAVIPIYVTELAEDRVRGTLGTFLVLSCNFGILLSFILGYYFNYATVAWILSSVTILFSVSFVFLPETPQYLIKENKPDEAEAALRYFRRVRLSHSKQFSEVLQIELKKLRKTNEKSHNDMEVEDLRWQDFSNYKARKALFIGLGLMALNQFCGCFAMINYTASIFQQAGSSLSPKVSAIIVGLIQLLGAYMSTLLVDRAGRKFLLLVSATGTGLGLSCLGIYGYMESMEYNVNSFAWVPVASFSFTIFIACWGILTLPFLVVFEIIPPKIRNIANMVLMTILWIFAFFMIKFLPMFTEVFGMHSTMFIFSSSCFAGSLFIAVFVPETKGKSIEIILENL